MSKYFFARVVQDKLNTPSVLPTLEMSDATNLKQAINILLVACFVVERTWGKVSVSKQGVLSRSWMRYLGRWPQGVAWRSCWMTPYGVFGDEVSFAAGHICQRGGDEGNGSWFSPLFDSTAGVFAEIEKVFAHAGMASPYLVDFPV